MLRSLLSKVAGSAPRASSTLPYDMFDAALGDVDQRRADNLERIYHRGQEKIWDGKQVLAELVEKHGRPKLDKDTRDALQSLFGLILWGELAAWKVSAELALQLEPLEAKLAATSQAHDEARHFYVMHDYLALLGDVPRKLGPTSEWTLTRVLTADSLVKKLIGMQLMVEPIALTIFQTVREQNIEPVLTELLPYYERDEARHVALGVNHLPALLKGMGRREMARLIAWELRMFDAELQGMKEIAVSFEKLGVSKREVLRLGQAKQLLAFQAMSRELGGPSVDLRVMKRMFDARIDWMYPPEDWPEDTPGRLVRAAEVVWRGNEVAETTIAPEPIPA
jgi:hypothetical protein